MHYSLDNLRYSLRHFFIGKTSTAITALLLLVLLARWLPKEDYAVYVSLQAILVIVNFITSFGVSQSLLRYIPELRVANNNLPMYSMSVRSLVVRSLAIGAGFLVVWALLPWLGQWFNLAQWQNWVPVYLLVGWLRLSGQFLGRIMETLLWQKQSQYSQAVGSLIRLVAIALTAAYAKVDIPTLFVIELVSEGLIVMFLVAGYVRQWRADPKRNDGDSEWWRTNRERSRRYALWSYLATLTSIFAGSAPYRLVAAKMLLPEGVALYGFASVIMDMVNRYTPTRLMQGTIRSVLVARYLETDDKNYLLAKLNLNLRVNVLLLSAAAALILCSGRFILDWLTNGKYGQADIILALMMGVLLLDALRAQLEMLAEIYERNEWALMGNFALVAGLLMSFLVVNSFSIYGLVISAMFGQLISILVLMIALGFSDSMRIVDSRTVLLPCFLVLVSFFSRMAYGQSWLVVLFVHTSLLVLIAILALVFKPITKSELVSLVGIFKMKRQ